MDLDPTQDKIRFSPAAMAAVIGILSVFAVAGVVLVMATGDLGKENVDLMDETVTYLGSHRLSVKPGSRDAMASQSGIGTNTVYRFQCRQTRIELRPGSELVVNGFTFGNLEREDEILVDEGRVLVNGRLRAGLPLITEDIEVKTLVPNEEYLDTTLKGHDLRIIPRPDLTTRVAGGDSHSLRADDRNISIRGSELIVDGVHVGILSPGDAVTVSPDQVSISPGNDEEEGQAPRKVE